MEKRESTNYDSYLTFLLEFWRQAPIQALKRFKETSEAVPDLVYSKKDMPNTEYFTMIIIAFYFGYIWLWGIKFKKVSLVPFLAMFLFEYLQKFSKPITEKFGDLISHFLSQNTPEFITDFIFDERRMLFFVSLLLAFLLMFIYSIVKYIPIIIVANEMKNFVFEIFDIAEEKILYSFIGLILFCIIAKKLYDIFENFILALLFSSHGSLGVLVFCNLLTGFPEHIFEFANNLFEWRNYGNFEVTKIFFVWLAMFIFGFWFQTSIRK